MIAGVDEAGRGPVVGPLVIAVVAGDGEALRRLGVRDSKKLTPGAREVLYREVLRVSECVNYVVVEPYEVDRYASRGLLNALELDYTARLIELCPADVYYVDSPDVDADRYGSGLSFLTGRRVVALHKGEKVPQVAAASIVAKVVRDRLLEVVKREVGDFGSGYPSDRKTVEWLRAGLVPRECVRWSWGTVGKLFK
ncbi:ribonuclease HII [Pyrobaculum ferrireducens]|uniref:Ribonuclease HII n=1 Tax=Pyrobaculum ferrireducens TaxID=1104324 RepID=G7VDJ0_9CREN|nr:ribonuclease HII [Pyrobaculum ferrireducens]AET33969.1 ribonuclease HII [Pyrobaculum ferrireducens]